MTSAFEWGGSLRSALVLFLILASSYASAAIVLVQQASAEFGGNTNTLTANFPASPTSGDLLVAVLGHRGNVGTLTIPSGWTLAISASASAPGQCILYKVAGASEPSSVTVSGTNSTRLGLHIYEFSGVTAAIVLGTAVNTGSGTAISSGPINTTGNNELLFTASTINVNTSYSAWSNSFTEIIDFQNTGATSFQSTYAAAFRSAASPGAYATSATTVDPANWIIQTVRFAGSNSISGSVFEDVNYGGGTGRDRSTALGAGGSARSNARVELFDTSGNFLTSTLTNVSGAYTFSFLAPGNYTVRVVNGTVSSSRPGYVGGTHLAVQTFRTNAGSGTALPVTDRVGGEVPNKVDAANGSTTLAALTTATTVPQSIAAVSITASNISNVDFGFNFDLVVNTNDAGQGSLRQFIQNANGLGNDASLAQNGNRKNNAGANEALPAGRESSIFMIPNGSAVPGLRAGLANQLNANGVASIVPATALPAITGTNTILDGTTQTVNVGNTNALLFGTGGTVGVDLLALAQIPAPEVELRDLGSIPNGIIVQANDVTVRGMGIVGFGDADGDAAILVANNITNALVEVNVLGTRAHSFTDPGAGFRNWCGVQSDGGDAGTMRFNAVGFSTRYGGSFANVSNNWTAEGNEIRDVGQDYLDADGFTISSGANNLIKGNLITGTASQGVVITGGATSNNNTLENNTIRGNGVGTPSGLVQSPGICMRSGVLNNTVIKNRVHGNHGAGIMVNNGATGTRISQNSFLNNGTIGARNGNGPTGQIGIDLNAPGDNANLGNAPFFTLNDAGDGDSGGNDLQNFPVITSALVGGGNTTLSGTLNSTASVDFTIEFFSSAAADPTGYGEGNTYLGSTTVTTNAAGNASFTTTLTGVTVPAGHVVTATATRNSLNNTSEFSAAVPVTLVYAISGRVFEDLNYGGGSGRDRATAQGNGGSGRPNARVELYNSSGNFVSATTTNASGDFTFSNLPAGDHTIRVVNSSVSSARAGYVPGTHLAVQTFRTNASSGTAVPVTDRVGGEVPNKVDPGNGSTTLAALNTATTAAQSSTVVTIGAADVTGVDFGYNFNTIVNTNNAGQGSLRQFITNANGLANTGLAIAGQPAGQDVSIFMIGNGTVRPGLNSGMPDQLTAGVATIALSSALPALTASNTSIDATTQTMNVGNTNAGVVGTGGTVGVDALALPQYPLPEVAINANDNNGLVVNGNVSGTLIQGLSIHNASSGIAFNGGSGSGNLVRNVLSGTLPNGSAPAGALRNSTYGIIITSPTSCTVDQCFVGWNGLSGILGTQPSASVTATYNELVGNGWNSNSHDALDIDGINSIVRYNLSRNNVTGSGLFDSGGGNGVELGSTGNTGLSNNLVENNTIQGNTSSGVSIRNGMRGVTVRRNIITGNHHGVIVVTPPGTTTNRNRITENNIQANTSTGIDLGTNAAGDPDGVSPNDGAVNATLANDGMDKPVITSSGHAAGTLTVAGHIGSAPNQSQFAGAIIEFFKAADDGDNNGEIITGDGLNRPHGEGGIHLGNLVADANGNFSGTISTTLVVSGDVITATATGTDNSTSEFGPNALLNLPPVALCQDITITVDGSGNASILPGQVDNGSYDPDGTVSLSVSPNTFTCTNAGPNTVTLTVTDDQGATATCTATVTVIAPDNDGDGICDAIDLDDDNDGIPDIDEGGDLLDTDGDGVPDRFDLDSDNDGIYDVVEAGSGQPFTNGVLNGAVTANGIPVAVDADANDVVDYVIKDSDSDGNIDSIELDSDNDGCPDVIEAGYVDHNGDGQLGNVPLTVNGQGVVTSTAF